MVRLKRSYLIFIVVFVFISWNILTYILMSKPGAKIAEGPDIEKRLNDLAIQISQQRNEYEIVRLDLMKLKAESDVKELQRVQSNIIPILLIACDRTTVSRSLDQLIKYRPSPAQFPIIVSQDCGHLPTSDIINSYVVKNQVKHIKHPNQTDIILPWPQKKFTGYYKISRHYKWALNQIFHTYNYSAVVIVEDDLDIAPDFFEYFSATYPILVSDAKLWCVSAWNDNGKSDLVADEPEVLYRTDFFPGLGWMLEKKTWLELEPKWPQSFWDDWMRHPDQRLNRDCIRPELSRTKTFGKKGVSLGLFYEKFLKFFRLNSRFVPFNKMDLSYLEEKRYEKEFLTKVFETPLVSFGDIGEGEKNPAAKRIEYNTKDEFKSLAKKFGIMDDFKAGIPRTAYRGVVTFIYKNQRVYLTPPKSWTGYDLSWS